MAKTTLSGPLRTGKETGAPSTTTIGTVVLNQQTTVTRTNSAQTTIAVLPENSDAVQFFVHAVSAFASGAAGVVDVRIGTPNNETLFGSVRVSGAGVYALPGTVFASAGTSWLNLTGTDTTITARVTAVGSAMTIGKAIVRTVYNQRT